MGSSVADPDLRLALVVLVLTALAAAADHRAIAGHPHRGRHDGDLLGGGTPLEAGAAQLLVLLGLLAAELLAVWAITERVGRGALLEHVRR